MHNNEVHHTMSEQVVHVNVLIKLQIIMRSKVSPCIVFVINMISISMIYLKKTDLSKYVRMTIDIQNIFDNIAVALKLTIWC